MTAEAKVGLMTIIGVLLLFFVVVGLSHGTLFRPSGMTVHVTFADANGLQAGNSVRYVGVNVGKVETVATGKDGVEVTLLLKKMHRFPRIRKPLSRRTASWVKSSFPSRPDRIRVICLPTAVR